MMDCDFCNKNRLKNTHYKHEPLDLRIISDEDGFGVILLDGCRVRAVFEIYYCPICGKKLEQEEPCINCDCNSIKSTFNKFKSRLDALSMIDKLETKNAQLKEEIERLRMQLSK